MSTTLPTVTIAHHAKEVDVMEGSDIVRAVTEQTAAQNRHLSPRMMRLLAFVHECRGELLSAVQYEEMADAREEVDLGPDRAG